MTETTSTKWECDRCGRTFKSSPNQQPTAWGYVVTGRPPRANPNDNKRQHLCPACLDSFSKWLNKDPETPRFEQLDSLGRVLQERRQDSLRPLRKPKGSASYWIDEVDLTSDKDVKLVVPGD